MFGGMKMDEYNGFESKEEYLQHIKKLFYKNGMKCMIISIGLCRRQLPDAF